MRVLLVLPDAHMHKLPLGRFRISLREAPLTLTTLAALAPADLDISWRLVDGSVQDVPLQSTPDLVAISVMTGTAREAYRIADHFRGRRIPVVLGGIHATLLPDEAALHADAVVIGRAEQTWPQLLRDFHDRGLLAPVYEAPPEADDCLRDVPSPRRDLQRNTGYVVSQTVQATRGCPHACDFCTVPAIWPRYLRRPVADVVRDVRALPGRYFAFNDVSLLDDADYAGELLEALVPLKKRWGGLATTAVSENPRIMRLLEQSGCRYLLLGFESLESQGLRTMYKGFNRPQDYRKVVDCLHDHGISVQGCFVLGLDTDDATVFDRTVARVDELRIDIPRFSIYTPYPGTRLFGRLLREGRIISFNWEDYDTMHVVIRPALMTPDELYAGFKRTYREVFRLRSALRRIRRIDDSALINLVGHLAYRIFVWRLHHEPRYARPFSEEQPPFHPERHPRLFALEAPPGKKPCPA